MKSNLLHFAFVFVVFAISLGGGFKVEYKGALKNIMHNGDLTAKASLSEFGDQKHFYALGAVENLKGEILVLDSKPFVSSVSDDELVIDSSFQKNATLLVYTTVQEWTTQKIPQSVRSYAQLEAHIEKAAEKHGIDTGKPFPFLIEGTLKSGDWQVIDWPDGDTEHTHEKHIHSGLYGTVADRDVTILGFWSNQHHAVFTHHTTNMHMHFRTGDGKLAGHLDDVNLGKKMVLNLPKIK